MRQVVSSGWTIVYKSLVPLFLVTCSVLVVVSMFYYPPSTPIDVMVGPLVMIGATAFFCWFGAKIKQVRIDEHNLYVAGFFKEISIPITAIDSIGGFHNGSPVTLRLKEKSEFGRRIFFVAKWMPVLPWQAHPIFTQLRELIKEKQIGQH